MLPKTKTRPFFKVLGFVFLSALNAYCIEPANPELNKTAREILEYFHSVYQKKMLCGYNVYVHTPDDYERTGKQAAIWGRDIRWLGDTEEIVKHVKRHRYILTLHWHWFFNGDSAWTRKRNKPVDVGKMATPGTETHKQLMIELEKAADKLQVFEDNNIPVLWRPLHEIDGGWFWWTDKENPENTAKLWRIMFDYFTHTRKLNHLIWVYSAGVGNKGAGYRRKFYPGAEYVDISGIDIYGVDFKTADEKYWNYYKTMKKVSPGKMLACGECDAIPNPDLTQKGKLPKWLYALPWWGAPSRRRPADWARYTMRHEFMITLDQLPPWGDGPVAPHIGLMQPLDDGSAWFTDTAPVLTAEAVDRDGSIKAVRFYDAVKTEFFTFFMTTHWTVKPRDPGRSKTLHIMSFSRLPPNTFTAQLMRIPAPLLWLHFWLWQDSAPCWSISISKKRASRTKSRVYLRKRICGTI